MNEAGGSLVKFIKIPKIVIAMTNQSDFFGFLITEEPIHAITMAALAAQTVVIPAALIGIIWFETTCSTSRRTLLNLMVLANCCAVLEFM